MFYPYRYGYGYGYPLWDPAYLWVLLALLFSMICSMWVNSTFRRYSQVRSSLTGAQAARYVLDKNGLYDVRVERVSGSLSDHYDPRTNVVRLSDSTYGAATVAAVGVALHEVGHAIQHARHYFPMQLRTMFVPVVNIANNMAIPLFLLGLFLDVSGLMWAGVICFSATLIFGLLTLPVELNASYRALNTLKTDPKFSPADYAGAKKVLIAAASTYLASVFVSLAQLLRYVGMARRNDDRR